MIDKLPYLQIIFLGLFGYFVYDFLFNALDLIPEKKSRVKKYRHRKKNKDPSFDRDNLLLNTSSEERTKGEFSQLLQEAGLRIPIERYKFIKQIIIVLILGVIQTYYIRLSLQIEGDNYFTDYPMMYILSVGFIIFSFFDKAMLRAIGRYREEKQTGEIHQLSKRLGFYIRGNYTLHEAIERLAADANILKQPLNLLYNEWYSGAEDAIIRLGQRLGTRSGLDFSISLLALKKAPTIETIKILQDRSISFKRKSQARRSTRKEGISIAVYVFTVLPMILILIWFIYPWAKDVITSLDQL